MGSSWDFNNIEAPDSQNRCFQEVMWTLSCEVQNEVVGVILSDGSATRCLTLESKKRMDRNTHRKSACIWAKKVLGTRKG